MPAVETNSSAIAPEAFVCLLQRHKNENLVVWMEKETDKQSPAERFFDTRVAPILHRRCVGCHNPQLNNGGLSILERESLLKGGTRGPAVLPGRPERSLLI